MAQYKFYIDKTLRYMKHALYRINQTERAFRNTCQMDAMIQRDRKRHFNFLKWHVILCYRKWIKRYRSTMDFIIGIRETIYITQIKNFFKQTNIRKDYKRQILDHNVEKFSLMLKDNIDIFFSTKRLIQTNKNAILQVNFVSDVKKIREGLK